MAFTINVDRGGRASPRGFDASRSGRNVSIAILVLFVAFCLYDYSSYGQGYVGASLSVAQRAVQSFFASNFRVRL